MGGEPILGMAPTGRRIGGPAMDLVEVESSEGLHHTAICYYDEFIEHPALLADLNEFGKFMEDPGVTGLSPLKDHDDELGQYLYPTGTAWSVAEVVRAFADLGETCGIRAGLELAYVTSQILQEAEEEAARFDLYNHGSLDPWRIMIKRDGQVLVIGYGMPQVEVLDFLEDESLMPKEDSFRYAPPERLEDEGENLSSDLFSLSLVALEVMTGRPVYDGLINDIRQQATRAEGAYRLYKWRNLIPDKVREAMGRALKYDIDARYSSATDYVYAMHDLLGNPDIEGPSLLEVMKRVRGAEKKGKPLIGGRTGILTKDELKRMAEEFEEADDQDRELPPPRRPRPDEEPEPEPDESEDQERWGKASRSGRRSVADRKSSGGQRKAGDRKSGDRGKGRERKRRASGRRRGGEGRDKRARDLRQRLQRDRSSSGRSESEDSGSDDKEDLRESLKRRLRESAGRSGKRLREEERPPEEPEEPVDEAEDDEPEVDEEPEETEMPEDEDTTTSGAAALLERLRSSAGRRSSGAPKRGGDEAPKAEPEAPAASPKSEAPAGATAPPTSTATRSERSSARDRSNDAKAAFQVEVPGQPTRKTRLRLGDSLAEIADRLAHALSAMPTDLAGRITGWFRLEQDGEWFRGDETADVLDPGTPITLARVPNRVVRMVIEVRGTDPPARFQAPVGTAVPVQSLVAHVVETLDLPDGRWSLYVGDERLDPLQILEDFQPSDGFVVVVKG